MVEDVSIAGEELVRKERTVNYAVSSISLNGAIMLGSIIGLFTGLWLFVLIMVAAMTLLTQYGGLAMLGLVGASLFSAGTLKALFSFAAVFTVIGLLTGACTALFYNIALSKFVPVRLMLEEVI